MISIEELEFYNFITYESQTFYFKKMFGSDNILFIFGKNMDDSSFANDNGAGKSIIYEGLVWLLTDRTTRGSSKDSLIGKFAKSMYVKGTFRNDNNDKIIITRYRKDSTNGNGARIRVNKENFKSSSVAKINRRIQTILGFSYRELVNTSIFESNDQRSRLIYLSDKEGKALLSRMKGFEIFSECSELSKDEANSLNKKIYEIQLAKAEIEKKINFLNGMKNDEKKLLKSLRNKQEEEREEISNKIKIEKKRTKRTIIDYENNIKELKNKQSKFESKITDDVSEEQLNQLMKSNNELKLRVKQLNIKAATYKERIRNKTEELEQVRNNKSKTGSVCTFCGGIISLKKIRKIEIESGEEISKLHDEIKRKDKMASELEVIIDRDQERIDKLKEKIEEQKRIKERINHTRQQIKFYVKAISAESKKLKRVISTLTSRQEESDSIVEVKKRIDDISKQITNNEKEINALSKQILTLRDEENYKACWAYGFGKEAIQTYALRSAVATLNEQMGIVSERLTDGQITVKLLTEKTSKKGVKKNIFEFRITDSDNKKVPFKDWSKGQKKRIEIITSFALMKLEDSVLREVFLDEMFDGIDDVGIMKIVEMLNAEAEENNRRFIVFSHSKNTRALFQNKAYVKKNNGKSKFFYMG
jgi:DNA repair exonuclease SbcCD ATPase subunit